MPERTSFLEDLHEEANRPNVCRQIERITRHMYDIVKMMDQPFAMDAMLNEQRYEDIVPIEGSSRPGVDYTTYFPHTISFQPPYSIEDVLRDDYKQMQIGFIYANDLLSMKLWNN